MEKFLLKILLFFGIVAVVDFGFGKSCEWLLEHAKGGRMKGVHQSAMVQTSDIVILGSSRAHHHYVTSVLEEGTGMTVHNCGVDGNGIVMVTGLYGVMNERYAPKVILYDVEPAFDINVYAEDGNNTRYIGWIRPYYSHPKVKETICRVDPAERYKNLSSMFRYNSKIADLLKDQLVISDYTEDGYAPLFGEMTKEPTIQSEGSKSEFDTLKSNMMEEFISQVSKTDTRLIMVASPRYGASSSEVFAPVKDLCERYGVEFWDYYSVSEFQRMEYFKEQMHLNNNGAKTYSRKIGERLVAFLTENK